MFISRSHEWGKGGVTRYIGPGPGEPGRGPITLKKIYFTLKKLIKSLKIYFTLKELNGECDLKYCFTIFPSL
jgi:hypothetical protein